MPHHLSSIRTNNGQNRSTRNFCKIINNIKIIQFSPCLYHIYKTTWSLEELMHSLSVLGYLACIFGLNGTRSAIVKSPGSSSGVMSATPRTTDAVPRSPGVPLLLHVTL